MHKIKQRLLISRTISHEGCRGAIDLHPHTAHGAAIVARRGIVSIRFLATRCAEFARVIITCAVLVFTRSAHGIELALVNIVKAVVVVVVVVLAPVVDGASVMVVAGVAAAVMMMMVVVVAIAVLSSIAVSVMMMMAAAAVVVMVVMVVVVVRLVTCARLAVHVLSGADRCAFGSICHCEGVNFDCKGLRKTGS